MENENKGALALLNCYSSESSSEDEESKCFEKILHTKGVKRRNFEQDTDLTGTVKKVNTFERLPVPGSFLNTNNKTNDNIDDPLLHEGRIRSFAHERGNWATYVYIAFEAHTGIAKLISTLKNNVPNFVELKCIDDFHISLTKTVALKHHWITLFVDNIKEKITHFRRFSLFFDGLKVYCNEERTRTFLSIQVKNGHKELMEMVNTLDKCLLEFRLPTFYKNPSFHMSVAWCVGDFEEQFNQLLPQLNTKLLDVMNNFSCENWYIDVNSLSCKIGNKFYNFPIN